MKAMFAVSVLSVVTLFASVKPVRATTTAGELQSYCKTAEENHTKGTLTAENGFCIGYVASFLQTANSHPIFRIEGKFYGLVLVKDISTGDAVVTFVKYMTAHPEKANDDLAHAGLLSAFLEAKIVAIVPVVEDSQTQ